MDTTQCSMSILVTTAYAYVSHFPMSAVIVVQVSHLPNPGLTCVAQNIAVDLYMEVSYDWHTDGTFVRALPGESCIIDNITRKVSCYQSYVLYLVS